MYTKIKQKKILIAHSNTGAHIRNYHMRREQVATQMGFRVTTLPTADYFPYMTFPKIDILWKKRDRRLMDFYDLLGKYIDDSDIFIHLNGSGVHPDFLNQFRQLKIYHCADDPDASELISRPVANAYDIHAISNPACLEMYRKWGCQNVFFWPLGSPRYVEQKEPSQTYPVYSYQNFEEETFSIVYVGSMYGTANFRYISRFPYAKKISFLWKKKQFFSKLEKRFSSFRGYGEGWGSGFISDEDIESLYRNTLLGINVHNSLGPINERLYDLAAFGVCQICDNKNNLNLVFEEGREILGFSSDQECFELIDYYLNHPDQARSIGLAAQKRFLKDYTVKTLWLLMIKKIESWMTLNNCRME